MSLKSKVKNLLERVGKIMFRSQDKKLNEIKKTVEIQSREIMSLRYLLTTMQPREPQRPHPHIVVSLTTFPPRISAVSSVIENMLAQTVVPDRIVLYLSEQNFPNKEEDLPVRLLRLQQHGLELRWLSDDLRSYKKILPALREFPEDLVITVDDDLTYPSYLIEKLVDAHLKHPRAICSVRTHRVGRNPNGSFKPYKQWQKDASEQLLEPRYDLFATTGAGTLFPPHIFGEEFWNVDAILELCPTADDVWVKFMSMKYNVPVVLATPVEKLKYLPNTQADRLWTVNISANDTQFAAMLDKYGTDIWDKME